MKRKQLQFIGYFLIITLIVALSVGMTACKSKKIVPILSSIAVTPDSATTIAIGATQQFIAIATYSDGSTENVSYVATWSSSDTSIAGVSQWGKVSGLVAGNTNITATYSGITSPALPVSVKLLSYLGITPKNPGYLFVGSTQQFAATGTFADGSTADITDQVTWSNNSTIVATISATGLATGLGAGTTDITASLAQVTSTSVPLSVMSQ
jgi:hypothetical protein